MNLYQKLRYLFSYLNMYRWLHATPAIMIFLPTLLLGDENSECESNPITLPVYTYFSRSACLANVTVPIKQFFKVKSEVKLRDHASNM